MNYRIYILDNHNRIVESRDFEGRDDLSALDKAASLGCTTPMEIWQMDRLVAQIGPDGAGAPNKAYLTRPGWLRSLAA